jgi:hypothetical protein
MFTLQIYWSVYKYRVQSIAHFFTASNGVLEQRKHRGPIQTEPIKIFISKKMKLNMKKLSGLATFGPWNCLQQLSSVATSLLKPHVPRQPSP